MSDLAGLFPGLYVASWRGVEFHMPDSRHEVGRRMQRFLFPGRDDTIDEDLGALDGPIHVTGVLLGDDYIFQAKALEAAFRAPGPGTLSHPWLGEIEAVLASPGQILFDARQMRTATFEATFLPHIERAPAAADALTRVLTQLIALRGQVKAMLRQVLAPLAVPLAIISYSRAFAVSAVATWRQVLAAGPALSALAAETETALLGLSALGTLSPGQRFGEVVADRLDAVPRAVADAATLRPEPAIGGIATDEVAVPEPAIAAALLMDAAALWPAPGQPTPAPALALAARVLALAAAIDAATAVRFDSQPQARRWYARLDSALALAAADAAALARTAPLTAGPVWRALADLRRAVAIDGAVRIGRLPPVATLVTPGTASVWHIAHHVAGDAPATVLAQLTDLVVRNGLRRPATVPPGPLEILRPVPAPAGWVGLGAPPPDEAEATAAGGQRLDIDFVLDVSRLG